MNDQPLLFVTPPERTQSLDPLLVAIVRTLQSIEKRATTETPSGDGADDDGEELAA